jgi:hypothetical protein
MKKQRSMPSEKKSHARIMLQQSILQEDSSKQSGLSEVASAEGDDLDLFKTLVGESELAPPK